MSALNDFVARCVARGEAMTVHDHLVADEKTKDRAEYRSLKAATERSLKENAKNHHLLGSVFLITPAQAHGRAPTTGGPKYGSNPEAIGEHKNPEPPEFTTGYALVPFEEIIAADSFANPLTVRDLTDAQHQLAKTSPKTQEIVTQGFKAYQHEKQISDIKAAAATERAEDLRKDVEAARQREVFFQDVISKLATKLGDSEGGAPLSPSK